MDRVGEGNGNQQVAQDDESNPHSIQVEEDQVDNPEGVHEEDRKDRHEEGNHKRDQQEDKSVLQGKDHVFAQDNHKVYHNREEARNEKAAHCDDPRPGTRGDRYNEQEEPDQESTRGDYCNYHDDDHLISYHS